MLAPGTILRAKVSKARYRVLGVDSVDGTARYVVEPADEHGAPQAMTVAEIRKAFSANVEAPEGTDAVSGWSKLAAAFSRHARAAARGRAELGPTPEEQLAAAAEGTSSAKRHAEGILADPEKLADYEAGLLPTHPAVVVHLDAALRERDRKEPIK